MIGAVTSFFWAVVGKVFLVALKITGLDVFGHATQFCIDRALQILEEDDT